MTIPDFYLTRGLCDLLYSVSCVFWSNEDENVSLVYRVRGHGLYLCVQFLLRQAIYQPSCVDQPRPFPLTLEFLLCTIAIIKRISSL
jgi:hypothetical protein